MSKLHTTRRALLAMGPAAVLMGCSSSDRQAGFSILDGVLTPAGGTAEGASAPTSSSQAALGIREALEQGVRRAVSQVGRQGGYFGDPQIRIPLPKMLADTQSRLRSFGLAGMLDDLELKLNRGAEAAAPQATGIFVDAIKAMTIQDALGIVNGGQTSATDYFQRRTVPALTELFRPPLRSALEDAGAIRVFDGLANSLRSVPLAPRLGSDAKDQLIDHGVEKGLDGLFYYIGREEVAIRQNPAQRTTQILRQVFG